MWCIMFKLSRLQKIKLEANYIIYKEKVKYWLTMVIRVITDLANKFRR